MACKGRCGNRSRAPRTFGNGGTAMQRRTLVITVDMECDGTEKADEMARGVLQLDTSNPYIRQRFRFRNGRWDGSEQDAPRNENKAPVGDQSLPLGVHGVDCSGGPYG